MSGPGIGHNSGRAVEPGVSARRFAWAKARRDLLPSLPVEVVRLRVARAKELGLPYRTYAGLRASTGHDLIGFLFSSNALGVLRPGDAVPDKLAVVRADRVALAQSAPVLAALQDEPLIDAAARAPHLGQGWSATRAGLRAALAGRGPADRFLVIGATALERDWSECLQAAGYLDGAAYFSPEPATA